MAFEGEKQFELELLSKLNALKRAATEKQVLYKISFGQNKRYKKSSLFSFASSNSSQFYF